MAFQYPYGSVKPALDGSISVDCFYGIFRAGRNKPAAEGHQRRNHISVKSYCCYQNAFHLLPYYQAERRILPFALLFLSILLPPRVLIRVRNPCVFLRLNTFGWYVVYAAISTSRPVIYRNEIIMVGDPQSQSSAPSTKAKYLPGQPPVSGRPAAGECP
jgi:hypothetical protein